MHVVDAKSKANGASGEAADVEADAFTTAESCYEDNHDDAATSAADDTTTGLCCLTIEGQVQDCCEYPAGPRDDGSGGHGGDGGVAQQTVHPRRPVSDDQGEEGGGNCMEEEEDVQAVGGGEPGNYDVENSVGGGGDFNARVISPPRRKVGFHLQSTDNGEDTSTQPSPPVPQQCLQPHPDPSSLPLRELCHSSFVGEKVLGGGRDAGDWEEGEGGGRWEDENVGESDFVMRSDEEESVFYHHPERKMTTFLCLLLLITEYIYTILVKYGCVLT